MRDLELTRIVLKLCGLELVYWLVRLLHLE